jgi:three-Cys-motif partner protein
MTTDGFFDESSEQSRVKAAIVSKYFWAWAKVILHSVKQRGGTIAYVDLFAGPGRYKDNSRSTPLLVLEQAIADPEMCQHLTTLFNDASVEHASILKKEIDALLGIERLAHRPIVQTEEVGERIVGLFRTRGDVPTLFFVDPWGYKGLSLGLINFVLQNWGCDCIFFFNYNRINAGINNSAVRQHMDVLFGEERAEKLRVKLAPLTPGERETTIVEELTQAIRDLGPRFVLPFCFKNEGGTRTSHHLIFATKHPRGYGIMKEIMAGYSSEKHEGVPSFEYSPASSIHPLLFELSRPLTDLEGMLLDEFLGRSLTMRELFDSHNVGRPYIRRNYTEILLKMEEKGAIQAFPDASARRKGTLADHVRLTFPKRRVK